MKRVKVSASILAADLSKLGEEVRRVDQSGADYIHLDIMDGHFVENLTFGPQIIKSIRGYTTKPFDVHLMIQNPEKYIDLYAKSGADIITVHAESVVHLDRILDKIKSLGKKAGVSLVPSTSENVLNYIYEKLDLILVMTVNPGLIGQEFISSQLRKIHNIKDRVIKNNYNIELAVDGGINGVTGKQCVESGADVLVAGSYIFSHNDYASQISILKNYLL